MALWEGLGKPLARGKETPLLLPRAVKGAAYATLTAMAVTQGIE